ncbi:MAG: hypothetical protein F6K39_31215 [Okeania sp. SIO3B3]|nr:hypothetical protein [Okeania sp. SIO3B3]
MAIFVAIANLIRAISAQQRLLKIKKFLSSLWKINREFEAVESFIWIMFVMKIINLYTSV